MILKFLRFVFGYVKIKVTGFAPERFMNLIIQHEFVVWNVETIEDGYTFYTGRKNLIDMKPYFHKTKMRFHIEGKYGLPYFLKRYRKRSIFVLGCGICCFLLYILSLFVWEIKVEGEDKLVNEEILKYVEEKHVPLGTRVADVNCGQLEVALKENYQDISWISCDLDGTVLSIHLVEGVSVVPKEEGVVGDVVASMDGEIEKIITRTGTPIAKVGDSVKKGDILISGTVYLYDDYNEILETDYVKADGDVIAKTKYEYEDYVSLNYHEKVYSSEQNRYLVLFIKDYCFTPYQPKMKCKDYDTFVEIHKLKIFDNFYLPIGCKWVTQKGYTLQQKEYTVEEAKSILKQRVEAKLGSFQQKGVAIIENNVKIEKDGNKVYAKGDFILSESIVSFQRRNDVIKQSK